MVYCIVEGKIDEIILSVVFKHNLDQQPKIVVSKGFPSMPAIARTILSYIGEEDKVIIVCDQDSFDDENYQKEMLGFLLRGADNNPQFKMVTFNPNIEVLIPDHMKQKGWKSKTNALKDNVAAVLDDIMQSETVREIMEFIEHA